MAWVDNDGDDHLAVNGQIACLHERPSGGLSFHEEEEMTRDIPK